MSELKQFRVIIKEGNTITIDVWAQSEADAKDKALNKSYKSPLKSVDECPYKDITVYQKS